MRTAALVCVCAVILLSAVNAAGQPIGAVPTAGSPGGPTSGDPVQPFPVSFGAGRTLVAADGNGQLSSSHSSEVDMFTGALVKRLHLPLPVGRNDLQPSSDLIYDSRAGNGLVGVGW